MEDDHFASYLGHTVKVHTSGEGLTGFGWDIDGVLELCKGTSAMKIAVHHPYTAGLVTRFSVRGQIEVVERHAHHFLFRWINPVITVEDNEEAANAWGKNIEAGELITVSGSEIHIPEG